MISGTLVPVKSPLQVEHVLVLFACFRKMYNKDVIKNQCFHKLLKQIQPVKPAMYNVFSLVNTSPPSLWDFPQTSKQLIYIEQCQSDRQPCSHML